MGAKFVMKEMLKCYSCDAIRDSDSFSERELYSHSSSDLDHQDGGYGDYIFDSPCNEVTLWYCDSCCEYCDIEPEATINSWECTMCEEVFEERDDAAGCC